MKITSINKENFQNIEKFTTLIPRLSQPKPPANVDKNITNSVSADSDNWQLDILSNALDKLANSIQPSTSNNHPLSLVSNYPIDDYTEALNELKKVRIDILSSEGIKAQANLDAINLLELFKD